MNIGPSGTMLEKAESLRLAVAIDLGVNLEPCFLLIRAQASHHLHDVSDHLFANTPDEGRTFFRDADHYLAAIFPRTRAHDVADVLKPRHQPARRCRGMPHLLRDGRHREHLFVIERREEKELREGNVPGREFLAEMQDETALQLHDDMREALGISAERFRRNERSLGDCRGIQPDKLGAALKVSNSLRRMRLIPGQHRDAVACE